MPDLNLTQSLTRTLAGDDFNEVLARLPDFQADVDARLAAAADDAERETVLLDAMEWNRRWLGIAQSLRAGMAAELRSLEAELRYAESGEAGHVVDTHC